MECNAMQCNGIVWHGMAWHVLYNICMYHTCVYVSYIYIYICMHKYNGGYIQPEIIVFPWDNGCFANKTRGISIEPWYQKWFQHGNCSPGRANDMSPLDWSRDMSRYPSEISGNKTETPRASAINSYKFHPFLSENNSAHHCSLKISFQNNLSHVVSIVVSLQRVFRCPIPALWLRRDSDIAMWKLECWEGWGFPPWATKLSQGQGMDRAWLQTRFTPQKNPRVNLENYVEKPEHVGTSFTNAG